MEGSFGRSFRLAIFLTKAEINSRNHLVFGSGGKMDSAPLMRRLQEKKAREIFLSGEMKILKDAPQMTDDLLVSLSEPAAYDPLPGSVRVFQTHGSCVFLTGRWAYKMKKGVKYEFFDFSTLEKRRAALHRELELNRRLAPGVYKDVVPVVEREGRLMVGEPGEEEAVEYLLRMREFPEDAFLPGILRGGPGLPKAGEWEENAAIMARIAAKVAEFHRDAVRSPRIASYGEPAKLRALFEGNVDECAALPEAARPGKSPLDACRKAFGRALRQLGPVLQARASEGFIRDLHGDFRMEHVVLMGGDVVIFDCIDFRDDFRYMDPAHELAAFVMELRQEGYAEEARAFLRAYLDETGDDALLPLLPVYILHRALVRGKVEALKSGAPAVPPNERRAAAALSARHFEMAGGIAARETPPRLVLIAGLMASGKSALARGIQNAAGTALHRSDPIRKELAGLASSATKPDAWERGLYSAGMTSRVYEALLSRARRDLAGGSDVIVDASFSRRSEREAFTRLARESGARLDLIECVCSAGERLERLERRALNGTSDSDGRVEIMADQAARFEAIEEAHIVVDTSGPKRASLAKGLWAIYAG